MQYIYIIVRKVTGTDKKHQEMFAVRKMEKKLTDNSGEAFFGIRDR